MIVLVVIELSGVSFDHFLGDSAILNIEDLQFSWVVIGIVEPSNSDTDFIVAWLAWDVTTTGFGVHKVDFVCFYFEHDWTGLAVLYCSVGQFYVHEFSLVIEHHLLGRQNEAHLEWRMLKLGKGIIQIKITWIIYVRYLNKKIAYFLLKSRTLTQMKTCLHIKIIKTEQQNFKNKYKLISQNKNILTIKWSPSP